MESKDLKVVLSIASLSLAMVTSSYILGNSIKEGLQSNGASISNAGNQIATSINNSFSPRVSQQLDSDILDESQAADYLKITTSQLMGLLVNSKAIDGRGIPHIKVGNTIRFSKTALSKWVSTASESSLEF